MVDLVAALACAAEDADVARQRHDERLEALRGMSLRSARSQTRSRSSSGRRYEVAEDSRGDVLLDRREPAHVVSRWLRTILRRRRGLERPQAQQTRPE